MKKIDRGLFDGERNNKIDYQARDLLILIIQGHSQFESLLPY